MSLPSPVPAHVHVRVARLACAITLPILLEACAGAIPQAPYTINRPTAPAPVATFTERTPPPYAQCYQSLAATQTRFTPLEDRDFGAGCSQIATVRLISLPADTGWIEPTGLGAVNCDLAQAFAGWARFGIDRAARQIFQMPIAKIETMGSYSCRHVAGKAYRSGHAQARAIDVSAFILADGRRISIEQDWNSPDGDRYRFLRLVRQSACRRFDLVLSPDYNADHHNHLHIESGRTHRSCR